MNKDQIKGEAKNIAGKVQEKAGKAMGSSEQQVKGQAKQVTGKMQKGVGNVKESVNDAKKH
jgi:uncharacterized protein YjbJ (UPF0337 family)